MESNSIITPVGLAALAALLAGLSLLVLALWRHKRASGGDVKLIGELGQVETKSEWKATWYWSRFHTSPPLLFSPHQDSSGLVPFVPDP
jgi:hypothetical protein